MEVNLDKVDSKLFVSPFADQFAFNIQMYEYRLKRVLSIDTTIRENQMEYLMAFDAFIALFRGLFLESFPNCYTVQNYFTALGRKDIADKIDAFLDGPFNDYSSETIRRALKFLADKFVCHLDPITSDDLGLANAYMSTLKNPFVEVNLQYITNELDKIMNVHSINE
jgi:hypothetical protein